MKKKKNKSLCKTAESSLSISTDELNNCSHNTSLEKDESSSEATDFASQKFKVQLCDDRDAYSKLIRSKWKNVVLLHPSIMHSLSICNHVLIICQKKQSLCVARPLKNIRKNSVCFPRENFGLKQGDFVSLERYEGDIAVASEVFVSLYPKIEASEDIIENIYKSLSNRFFSEGASLEFLLYDNIYEFTISQVSYEDSKDTAVCDQISQSSYLNEICSLSNLTLNDSSTCLQSTPHKIKVDFNQSFGVPAVSSTPQNSQLRLSEKPTLYTHNVNCTSDTAFGDFKSSYYKVSHKTKINVSLFIEGCKQNPVSLFNDIIGLQEQLHFIKTFLKIFLNEENHYECGTLIFTGPPGTGKTMVMEAISDAYQLYSERINWYDVYSNDISQAGKDMTLAFKKAIDNCPSIIFIDEINHLCPQKEEANQSNSQISVVLAELVKKLQEKKVVIIAASNSTDFDDDPFKTDGKIMQEIRFPLPSIEERKHMFQKLLNETKHSLTSEDIQDCAVISHGFSMKDIRDVVMDAQNLSGIRFSENPSYDENTDCKTLNFSDLRMLCKLKNPRILSSSSMKVKKVFWNEIGGMKSIKEKLKQLVEWPLKYPEAFKRFNIVPSKGVLMYGPPGCSKTMIARALATECNLNFISRNTSDLFQKYVGESEKAVRDMFALARIKSPSIIFLDEIDALVAERGSCSSGSGVGDRIVTSLLTEIDGIEELHGVLIVAATNRPDMLDEALIRNGRINHFIYVPLPDKEARKEILELQMKERIIDEKFDFVYLSEKTEGYTGAEIVNICNEAALQLLSEDFEAESPTFTMKHFERALNAIQPRTTKEMIDFYETFNSKFCLR